MSRPSFVHLRAHSEYSVVDGLLRVDELVERLKTTGQGACAITEECNLFSVVKFYKAAEAAGIKPIIGADVWLAPQSEVGRRSRLTCLCRNEAGYRQLTRLISRAYRQGQASGSPEIERAWLAEDNQGLIVLSGGREGDVGLALAADQAESAERLLQAWLNDFGDRYCLEVTRTGRPGEQGYWGHMLPLASRFGVPVVATNDVRFLEREDFDAHEARVCINQGYTLDDQRRVREYSPEQYLKTQSEMAEVFADLPIALANSVAIAERCNVEFRFGQYFLPAFPIPPGATSDSYLKAASEQGLEQRLASRGAHPGIAVLTYQDRLQHEAGVIAGMGFAGYFLIVADFIHWARSQGIPVGPGRGSGAGSLVAYALGITDLDPLAYDLLFERFLNPERVSMPDFDVDFCMDRRDEVIDYVAERYGRDQVAQIITHGTMAAKAVIRDTGRVLGLPYGFCDQLAKLIPFELEITLDKALKEPALAARYELEEDVRTVFDLARKLEGLVRNAGKHAGGVVIAPSPLTDFTALYCEADASSVVTQLDMSDVEAIGLVKFDFLGLRTLTIIDWAVRDINQGRSQRGEPLLDIATLPLDDVPTFELIRRAETISVFQLESRGMRELIKRLKPDSFEDLIALVALFRPGPLQSGMVDDFIDRKQGRAPVAYPHPALEPILKPTYGVIVYQEQVMQIAQVLAGYTLGAADLLRRAMGKKKPEEMAKQRSIFRTGAEAQGVDPVLAESIFDLMEKFAGYGFNKSHSAAYALVAYQTAWLKAHEPAQFMAAVLSADMDHTDKVVGLINETRRMGLSILAPDVGMSQHRFTVEDAHSIRYGLGAVRGVGLAALEGLFKERSREPFRNLFDLCRRLDTRKLNRRALEALIKSGAMDNLGADRASLIASLESALAMAEQSLRNAEVGQDDLFGLASADPSNSGAAHEARYTEAPPWSDQERLDAERETLGLYLTGHPFDRWRNELSQLTGGALMDVKAGRQCVAGLMVGVRVINTRRGKMAVVTLDDGTARIDCTLYSELYGDCGEVLIKDAPLVIEGTVGVDEFSGGLSVNAERVLSLDAARNHYARRLCLKINLPKADARLAERLSAALRQQGKGRCPVLVHCLDQEGSCELKLAEELRILLSEGLVTTLHALGEACRVNVEYV